MANYHISAKGTVAPCNAKKQCRLGGTSKHYSPETVALVSENTYTPVSKLTIDDIKEYGRQNPVPAFKGKTPGQDITDEYESPVYEIEPGWEVKLFQYSNMEKVIVVDDDKALIVTNERDGQTLSWLVQQQPQGPVNIGMIRVLKDYNDTPYVLCDIEVRDEYRGMGYSKLLAKGASDAFGDEIHTTGNYTPEGFERLRGTFPMKREDGGAEPLQQYRSMTFMKDWDGYRPAH